MSAELAGLPVLAAEANADGRLAVAALRHAAGRACWPSRLVLLAAFRARAPRAGAARADRAGHRLVGAACSSRCASPLNPMSVTLGALVIAISTEFSVLLAERYRQERAGRPERRPRRCGAPTAPPARRCSPRATTAIAGFAVLALSDIRMLRDFGLVTVVDLTVSLLGVLVVLPAVLVLAERGLAVPRLPLRPARRGCAAAARRARVRVDATGGPPRSTRRAAPQRRRPARAATAGSSASWLLLVAGADHAQHGDAAATPARRACARGARLPPFAVPLALSAPRRRRQRRHASPTRGGAGRCPACQVRGPQILNVCQLAERGPVVLAFFATRGASCDGRARRHRARCGRRSPACSSRPWRSAATATTCAADPHATGWRLPVGYDHDGALANLYGVAVCPQVTLAYRGGDRSCKTLELGRAERGRAAPRARRRPGARQERSAAWRSELDEPRLRRGLGRRRGAGRVPGPAAASAMVVARGAGRVAARGPRSACG